MSAIDKKYDRKTRNLKHWQKEAYDQCLHARFEPTQISLDKRGDKLDKHKLSSCGKR